MSLQDFASKARQTLKTVQELKGPIATFPRNLVPQDLSQDFSTTEALGQVGSLTFSADARAAIYLNRTAQAPTDLGAIAEADDPAETGSAYVSLVVDGKARLDASGAETLSGGLSASAGIEADSEVLFAQHRRYDPSDKALAAVGDFLGHLRPPFRAADVADLAPGEVLQLDFEGSATLRADAGWTYGFSRTLSGNTVEQFGGGETLGVEAAAKAGLTLTAGLSGRLALLVERSARTTEQQQWVRLTLNKKSQDFAGAELKLSATATVVQAKEYFDSVFEKALQLPDGLVAQVRGLDDRLAAVEDQLDQLSDQAKKRLRTELGKALDEVGLEDLPKLEESAAGLPSGAAGLLGKAIREARGLVDSLGRELDEYVDDLFAKAQQPLDKARQALGGWLDRYQAFRDKLRDDTVGKVIERAQEGIRLELAAAVNRTREREALLVLDLRLGAADPELAESVALARQAFEAAVRGRFAQALGLAKLGGDNGVELTSGSLKRSVLRTRQFSLRFGFFGFDLKKDLRSWRKIEIHNDLVEGTTLVIGKAGAALSATIQNLGRLQQAEELLFTFDLYAARQQGSAFNLGNRDTGYAAVLTREMTVAAGERALPRLMQRQVRAAANLLVDPDRAEALLERLEAESGDYTYELSLSFPPAAMGRVFQTDSPVSSLDHPTLEQALWGLYRRALDRLGYEVVTRGGEGCPLSEVMTREFIEQVKASPQVPDAARLPPLVHPQHRFPDGANIPAWVYTKAANDFLQAYLAVRDEILRNESLKRATQTLRRLAREVAAPPGLFAIHPIGAKYLMLALLEGPSHTLVRMTYRRGKVNVTLQNEPV